MLDRAAVCPLARTVLMWCRFQETIQALQECPGDRNMGGGHTLLPIAASLFTLTHGTQYACLVPEELARFGCLSDAEKAIFEEHQV